MRTPRSIDLAITGRCNLKCVYCSFFTSDLDVSAADLPTSEWLRFFEELNSCSVMDVTLEGGEPLIRNDIRDLIDGIVRNRMRYTILTNGTLITDGLAKYLASTGRCKMVQVSLDASNPDAHDYCRGKGNHERAMRGLQHLIDNKVPATVRITIHKGNVAYLEETIRYLLDEVGLPVVSTNSADYLGLCRENAAKVQLDEAERSQAMETLLRMRKQYGSRVAASAGPQAEALQWMGLEKARRTGRESKPLEGHLTACGCTMSKLAVRADGAIIPCVQLSHLVLGRINKDSLGDVWLNSPELGRLRERGRIPLDSFEYCRGCEYVRYCNGSCPATAYTVFGDVCHPSPDGCLRRFLGNGGRLPDECPGDV